MHPHDKKALTSTIKGGQSTRCCGNFFRQDILMFATAGPSISLGALTEHQHTSYDAGSPTILKHDIIEGLPSNNSDVIECDVRFHV